MLYIYLCTYIYVFWCHTLKIICFSQLLEFRWSLHMPSPVHFLCSSTEVSLQHEEHSSLWWRWSVSFRCDKMNFKGNPVESKPVTLVVFRLQDLFRSVFFVCHCFFGIPKTESYLKPTEWFQFRCYLFCHRDLSMQAFYSTFTNAMAARFDAPSFIGTGWEWFALGNRNDFFKVHPTACIGEGSPLLLRWYWAEQTKALLKVLQWKRNDSRHVFFSHHSICM